MTCAGACNCGPCVVGRQGSLRASYVSDGHGWGFRQLGQIELPPGGVEDEPCPTGWPAGWPCVFNPDVGQWQIPSLPAGVPGPGVPGGGVTEEEARRREAEAYARGEEEERGSFIKYTIIGSVISGVVGFGLAKVLG